MFWQLNYTKTRWFHAIFMPVIIEFSRCIGTYSSAKFELYYTFSCGSGLHRSQAGYFEPISKKIHIFEDSVIGSEMMLTVNKSGGLCVNSAILDVNDFDNFTIKAQDFMGTVNFEEDRITLNITR